MGAHVEHQFSGDFFLDEERLRKLKNLIEERVEKFCPGAVIKYKVYRGDSYYYDTLSVDDVVAETNEEWRKVTKLELFIESVDVLEFKISISSKEVVLGISGEDRDSIFLLFTDLKSYMQSEIILKFAFPRWMSTFFLMILFVGFGFIVSRPIFSDSPNVELYNHVLSSSSLEEKINYLIQRQQVKGRGSLVEHIPLLIFPVMFYVIFIHGYVMRFFRPSNIFVFGKRKEKYQSQKALADKLIWGVVVALIVSLVAGLLPMFLMR